MVPELAAILAHWCTAYGMWSLDDFSREFSCPIILWWSHTVSWSELS